MFKKAKCVWIKGREREMNLSLAFEARTEELENTELLLTACTFYRLFVNGRFVAFGPARTARGYARLDKIPLGPYSCSGENILRIEVAGYGCRSFSTCLGDSFLCAELSLGEKIIAYTGRDFTVSEMKERVQRTERYSVQRHFSEIWNMEEKEGIRLMPDVIPHAPIFLNRVAPYPEYRDIFADKAICIGTFVYDETMPCKPFKYSWKSLPENWGYFDETETERKPFRWLQQQRQSIRTADEKLPVTLKAGEYALFDLSRTECGFINFSAKVKKNADVVIGFSEYCEDGIFSFTNINCHNVIEYILPCGKSSGISFEPYAFRFAIVTVKTGEIELCDFGVKTYRYDISNAKSIDTDDPIYKEIYDSALHTFAHNAVDLYTDCPSRERAGFLCDSYFTANAEFHFFGKVPVEDAFLENFRLSREKLSSEGMLPMCYPSDIRELNGVSEFIPQWCMWYVIELGEYLTKRNKDADPGLFKESVINIIEGLEAFENEDGLLEDLPSWNFVEWSDANSWTKNVNYPSNFLYAEVFESAYRIYGEERFKNKAEALRRRTRQLSFDGLMFTDNALRDETGKLRNTGNSSEACQYYAILFGGADLNAPEYKRLSEYVRSGFKDATADGRKFVPVNAFIGFYLRLKSLMTLGMYELIPKDVTEFFSKMCERTGTLWEHRELKGSLDHGFASYAAYALSEALKYIKK